MNYFMRVFLLLVLSLPFSAVASELDVLSDVFQRSWSTGYVESQCGQNIEGLIQRGLEAGLALEDAEVLTLTNVGSSVFGLVNAERVRSEGRTLKAIEKNWYHHVILVHDGHVFDFDFLTEPTVLTVAEYFERMFFDEINPPEFNYLRVGRDRKRQDYKVAVRSARDYITLGESAVTEMSLGEYLDR